EGTCASGAVAATGTPTFYDCPITMTVPSGGRVTVSIHGSIAVTGGSGNCYLAPHWKDTATSARLPGTAGEIITIAANAAVVSQSTAYIPASTSRTFTATGSAINIQPGVALVGDAGPNCSFTQGKIIYTRWL